ncbi:hypothetical protein VAEU17_220019 [Vibrio aestuarianus]|nr:hypothetical protein VAEKB19_2570002 [Vibrio aestuarianus]CAH8191892.1 hypothetical protein VAEU17_220019 [Vibrio aestuarianus]
MNKGLKFHESNSSTIGILKLPNSNGTTGKYLLSNTVWGNRE